MLLAAGSLAKPAEYGRRASFFGAIFGKMYFYFNVFNLFKGIQISLCVLCSFCIASWALSSKLALFQRFCTQLLDRDNSKTCGPKSPDEASNVKRHIQSLEKSKRRYAHTIMARNWWERMGRPRAHTSLIRYFAHNGVPRTEVQMESASSSRRTQSHSSVVKCVLLCLCWRTQRCFSVCMLWFDT